MYIYNWAHSRAEQLQLHAPLDVTKHRRNLPATHDDHTDAISVDSRITTQSLMQRKKHDNKSLTIT